MDSMHVDCFAKYANDAKAFNTTGLKNNAKISLDDDDNVCLVATRKINPMEEIFCSYGAIYWKKYIQLNSNRFGNNFVILFNHFLKTLNK